MHPALLLLLLISALISAATAQPTSRTKPSPSTQNAAAPLRSTFEQLWQAGSWEKAHAALSAGYNTAPQEAASLAKQLLSTGNVAVRPVAASAIAAHADIDELVDSLRKLPATQFPDERRLFARRLGSLATDAESTNAVLIAASSLVDDPDAAVAAAAILSLADTGNPEAVGSFIHRLTEVPAMTNSASDNDRQILACATIGAFESLTGERPASINQAKAWWNQNKANLATKPTKKQDRATDDRPETGKFGGQTFYIMPRFNLFYRIGSTQKPAADGPLALETVGKLFELATREADQAFLPVVGRSHVPTMRLYLCDPNQFNAKAGNASFAGVTRGYEVVLKVDLPTSMPTTLWHEYIHVIHNCNFVNQPRWLSEGLAMSFSLSANSPAARRPGLTADGHTAPPAAAFTDMINWNSGGSGDSKEALRYATAHQCVDYLRFGGFGASDERLAFLMGQLSRRKSAKAALESIYGKSIKELDVGLREWSATK